MGKPISERQQIMRLLQWYRTPASGVIDEVSRNIARPEIDRLMFRLAEIDSGTKIDARVAGEAAVTFFGEIRMRYTLHREINEKGLLTLRKNKAKL